MIQPLFPTGRKTPSSTTTHLLSRAEFVKKCHSERAERGGIRSPGHGFLTSFGMTLNFLTASSTGDFRQLHLVLAEAAAPIGCHDASVSEPHSEPSPASAYVPGNRSDGKHVALLQQ